MVPVLNVKFHRLLHTPERHTFDFLEWMYRIWGELCISAKSVRFHPSRRDDSVRALLLIIGLMVYPVVRWFLYYKRIAYVFTDKRAVAYYKDSNEIDFQIEASGILNMQRSYRGGELVSLNTYTTEEGQDVEGRGVTRVVRTGFEGIPARILDFYRDTTN